jgi:hypothetical protein
MKNVERLPLRPAFRVPLHGAPPLRGWAVQYVSGIDYPEIKPGFWLSQWNIDPEGVTFNFDSKPVMSFTDEQMARAASNALRELEIETTVVKVGDVPEWDGKITVLD